MNGLTPLITQLAEFSRSCKVTSQLAKTEFGAYYKGNAIIETREMLKEALSLFEAQRLKAI
jgi:hypothetical protein